MTVQVSTIRVTADCVGRFDTAASPEAAIRLVGSLLVADGAVTVGHVEAAVQREGEHPTGLPAEVPFALVHTDEPGALKLAAGVGVFAEPVLFRRMDDPSIVVPVQLVVMLSVPDRAVQAEVLSELVDAFADPEFAAQLLKSSPPEIAAEIAARLG